MRHNYGQCLACGKFHINPFSGKKHTDKTKLTMRLKRLGTKQSEDTKRKISLKVSGVKNPRAKWIKMSKDELRPYFDEWVQSDLNINEYANKIHAGSQRIVLVFKKCFPEEYTEQSKKHLNSRARNGWDFQRDIWIELEREGYELFWISGRGVGDIVAFKKGENPLLIEATLKNNSNQKKINLFKQITSNIDCKALFIYRNYSGEIIKQKIK